MARWWLKAAVQRGLGMLPWSHRWNELFQRCVTRSLDFTHDFFEGRMRACRQHLEAFAEAAGRGPAVALDLGTGWYPVVPVGFWLCGSDTVYTVDVVPLLRTERVRAVLRRCVEYFDRGRLAQHLPGVQAERVEGLRRVLGDARLRTPEALLGALGVRVLVRDARATGLPAASVDLFASLETLGHIPAAVLAGIFAEFARLATPGAVMSHVIDLRDQYSYFDRSISRFNYLRYSARAWAWIDNPIIPQTRLRLPEYRRLVRGAGFRVVQESNTATTIEDLRRVPLAAEFRGYATEDLLVERSRLVAVREAAVARVEEAAASGREGGRP